MSLLFTAAQSYSAESNIDINYNKDECLLVSMNCKDNVDSLQQRISKLNKEIAKGTDVYTQDELKKLRDKLDDTVKTLESLEAGG
jgi:lipid II:glycine glycyltransferase (peptidoglycan interpeptide bridge formation enzyme)